MREAKGSRTPRVLLYHPINNTNFGSLDRFVDMGLEIPVDGFNFAPMNAVRDALAKFALKEAEISSVVSNLKGMRKRLDHLSLDHNIDEVLLRYGLGEKWWRKMPCYAAWFHTRFRINGDTQPCGRCDPSLSMGNFTEKPFREIWNGPGFRTFRRETMYLPKMDSLRRSCDCDYCCYVKDISRIHRIFLWLPPYGSRSSRPGH